MYVRTSKKIIGTVSSVSCQTENIIMPHLKPNLKEYVYPESLNTTILNNPYGLYNFHIIVTIIID